MASAASALSPIAKSIQKRMMIGAGVGAAYGALTNPNDRIGSGIRMGLLGGAAGAFMPTRFKFGGAIHGGSSTQAGKAFRTQAGRATRGIGELFSHYTSGIGGAVKTGAANAGAPQASAAAVSAVTGGATSRAVKTGSKLGVMGALRNAGASVKWYAQRARQAVSGAVRSNRGAFKAAFGGLDITSSPNARARAFQLRRTMVNNSYSAFQSEAGRSGAAARSSARGRRQSASANYINNRFR